MVVIAVKITKQKIRGKYNNVRITIPKPILDEIPDFKKVEEAEIDIDLLGNVVIRPRYKK